MKENDLVSREYLIDILNQYIEDCDEESTFEKCAKDAFKVCKTLIEDAPCMRDYIDGNLKFPQDGQRVIIYTGCDYVIAEYDKTFGRYLQMNFDNDGALVVTYYNVWNIRWWSPLIELNK